MKNRIPAVAACLLLPGAALAASPFDGTWKVSLDHIQLSKVPTVVTLASGEYTCSSCVPSYTVKADGMDQKVAGHAYDSVAVKTDASSASITYKLKGKTLSAEKDVVSADGKSQAVDSTDYTGTDPSNIKLTLSRSAPGPDGSHPLSGSWLATKVLSASGPGYSSTYALTDDGLTMSSNGQSYDAKFDGKKYPVAGDPTQTKVVVKKLAPDTVEELDYQKGKLVFTLRLKVSADGKTLHATGTDTLTHSITHWTMDKVS